MRIAMVGTPYVPVPPQKYGGTERVIHYLIKGLIELGHEPILIGTGDSQQDCEIIPIVDKALYYPKDPRQLPAFHRKIAKISQKTTKIITQLTKRVDIIHSHGTDMQPFVHFPHVTTLHCAIGFDELDYYHERRDQYFVTVSQNQQAAFPGLNYAGAVYNAESPEDFPIVTEPDDYVCFLGRFDREKAPHLAIQLALQAGIKIKLAGKTDYHDKNYFKEEIKPYLTHPLVEYLGELDFEHKVELLSHAKCNLHPTNFREPFGLTVMEAAYCGTPTLATRRGSMAELIEDGRTGRIVEDYIEGYHQIEECFAMNRRYIADRARHLFNYRAMTEQYLQVYERIVESYTQPAAKLATVPLAIHR